VDRRSEEIFPVLSERSLESLLMNEAALPPEPVVLGHFATYRLGSAFWSLGPEARRARSRSVLDGLGGSADAAQVYLVQGMDERADVLLWSTVQVDGPETPGEFFRRRAVAENAHRDVLEPVSTLWGMTRPSEYSRAAKSAQEIDPFSAQRAPYLVAYPFTKTAEWYLLGRDTRQGMMNEHIRIGKQYQDIKQLLLYSFGLQDQEFVVVYETADLTSFSKLVYDLRSTEGRRYTRADTPLHTAILVSADEWMASLG
jgi:chlorite dismutase